MSSPPTNQENKIENDGEFQAKRVPKREERKERRIQVSTTLTKFIEVLKPIKIKVGGIKESFDTCH